MNRLLGPVLAASLAVGGVGGTAAYRGLADTPPTPVVTSEPTPPPESARESARERRVVVRWSRCRPPSRPRGKVCVLRVVRTVER